MTDRVAHRGPDSRGIWVDDAVRVALGHRRLAIVDLTPAGHQPMHSADGRWVVIFNGEIYGHRVLRDSVNRVARVEWRGTSDTESLVEHIAHFGIQETLAAANGMFALACWDRRERTLWLARDHAGEKPLYVGWMNGVLLFGSELKALAAHPAWHGTIDEVAARQYARFGYVPGTRSIWRGISKVHPGGWVRCTPTVASSHAPLEAGTYWDLSTVIRRTAPERQRTVDSTLVDSLDSTLRRAVSVRLEADVPLGAFLSGGVDSSVIVALMRTLHGGAVHTFSIGFGEPGWDEAVHAERVAAHLGTNHVTLACNARMALDLIPQLPWLYDEPFADSSQIPTQLLAKLTRQHVTVALSGDGADELFGGYNRYTTFGRWWPYLQAVPHPVRRAAARGLRVVPPFVIDRLGRLVGLSTPGDKIGKVADALRSRDGDAAYLSLQSQATWLLAGDPAPIASATRSAMDGADFTAQMMATDFEHFLPDDVLVKVDRATMSVALEARAPYLDRDVVELAWGLPREACVRGGVGKWVLREVLARYVPRTLWERPKQGFGVPLATWLRGPLRDWAEALLTRERLTAGGIFDATRVRHVWRRHVGGQQDSHYALWTVLMFEAWRETWCTNGEQR